MIYAGGHISGAHYNPAVTLAVWIRNRIKTMDALIYMASQVLGAVLAAIVVMYLREDIPSEAHQTLDKGKAVVAELLGTFALAYVVLNVATAKANEGNSYFGLAIGFTVMAMAFALGQYSGGAFNPAVAIGAIVMKAFELANVWIYLVGCFIGGALAAIAFNVLNPGERRPVTGPEDKID
jgi:aquaporin Z